MCGIAGYPGVLDARFDAALDALAFRGPDQRGNCGIGGYQLGCQRLAITDADAAQPLVIGSVPRRLAIVMNGSIAYADALRLVQTRGRLMKQAGEQKPGMMAAVLGMDEAIHKTWFG